MSGDNFYWFFVRRQATQQPVSQADTCSATTNTHVQFLMCVDAFVILLFTTVVD